jgi:predicted alpha/beta hydrolase family esterase
MFGSEGPPVVLVGHSMGGSVAVHVAVLKVFGRQAGRRSCRQMDRQADRHRQTDMVEHGQQRCCACGSTQRDGQADGQHMA